MITTGPAPARTGGASPDRLRPVIQPLRGRTHVDLFEHEAKELFAEYGVPVPRGSLAATPVEARVIAAGFAHARTPRGAVKAQGKTGRRGQGGGGQGGRRPG